jgi:hypothetical protein
LQVVPAHYDTADTRQNKMIFVLAQTGEGTADNVIAELDKLEPRRDNEQSRAFVKTTLAALFEHNHLTGPGQDGQMHYNLTKITPAWFYLHPIKII